MAAHPTNQARRLFSACSAEENARSDIIRPCGHSTRVAERAAEKARQAEA